MYAESTTSYTDGRHRYNGYIIVANSHSVTGSFTIDYDDVRNTKFYGFSHDPEDVEFVQDYRRGIAGTMRAVRSIPGEERVPAACKRKTTPVRDWKRVTRRSPRGI